MNELEQIAEQTPELRDDVADAVECVRPTAAAVRASIEQPTMWGDE